MTFSWQFTCSYCKQMEYGNAIQVNNYNKNTLSVKYADFIP